LWSGAGVRPQDERKRSRSPMSSRLTTRFGTQATSPIRCAKSAPALPATPGGLLVSRRALEKMTPYRRHLFGYLAWVGGTEVVLCICLRAEVDNPAGVFDWAKTTEVGVTCVVKVKAVRDQ
jgi:hypothetical protein